MADDKISGITLPLVRTVKFDSKPSGLPKDHPDSNYAVEVTFTSYADIIEAAEREASRNIQVKVRAGQYPDNTQVIKYTYGEKTKRDPRKVLAEMTPAQVLATMTPEKMMAVYELMQQAAQVKSDQLAASEKEAQERMDKEENDQMTDEQLEALTSPANKIEPKKATGRKK